jgi:hypothetical protein
MVLLEGFSNAQRGTIFSQFRGVNDRVMAYAQCIERIFNTNILGDEDGPAQWNLPMNDSGKSVGIICLDNNRIRKIISNFELLVSVSVTDDTRLEKYNIAIPHYRDAMIILRQRVEFSDEEIRQFQFHVDAWFQRWIELHAMDGCTNYTHILSSGHMSEYMFKWRNLYRFSQQGWENFNHVFTTVYFRRTNHGGRRYEGSSKSKIKPIGKWLQRRLLWMTGLADDILSNISINYERQARVSETADDVHA